MPFQVFCQLMIYSFTLTICYLGVKEDMQTRKFSNKKIAAMILLGILSAYFNGRIKEGIILFVCMNILGIFMSSFHILGAADWKFFSAMCLFIPFEISSYSVIFAVTLMISAILVKIAYTHKGHLKEAFMDEWIAFKTLLYTRKLTEFDENLVTYKAKTTPATLMLVSAFVVTLICYI